MCAMIDSAFVSQLFCLHAAFEPGPANYCKYFLKIDIQVDMIPISMLKQGQDDMQIFKDLHSILSPRVRC